jgi:hypothetical protein
MTGCARMADDERTRVEREAGRALTVIEGDRADVPPLKRTVPTTDRRKCVVHRTFVLDHGMRKVFCDDCEAEVTAFDALASLEHEIWRWQIAVQTQRSEAKRIGAEVQELKRQRTNLRAQIRRATK